MVQWRVRVERGQYRDLARSIRPDQGGQRPEPDGSIGEAVAPLPYRESGERAAWTRTERSRTPVVVREAEHAEAQHHRRIGHLVVSTRVVGDAVPVRLAGLQWAVRAVTDPSTTRRRSTFLRVQASVFVDWVSALRALLELDRAVEARRPPLLASRGAIANPNDSRRFGCFENVTPRRPGARNTP